MQDYRRGTHALAASYVVCTNPRSGSWLLCEGLASTSIAGNPREWFSLLEEQQYRARWRMTHETDLSHTAYLDQVRRDSTTPNGISGVKLMYAQFAALSQRSASGRTPTIAETPLFPRAKYIWLTRRDRARQAISYFIAANSGEWWEIDGYPQDRQDNEPIFNAPEIERLENILIESDAKWLVFFNDHGIVPFKICYEDLAADYDGTIRAVIEWLGLPNANRVAISKPRLKRQSSERSEAWLARYAESKKQQRPPGDSTSTLSRDVGAIDVTVSGIPHCWKEWIAQSRLRGKTDEAIVSVLVSNGYDHAVARAEMLSA